ncbi:MAG: prepilin peptidase [Candidatus Paceibacterota bacterium]|jgi:prepilin signal peptidase PulO-like enzyme (type II secretory pathway)
MEILLYAFIFSFGICIGSFLNVLIYRLPRDISITKKTRSFCPKCKKKLSWWELIPLFSFLFLRGKCFKCKKNISWRYPVVELLTGLLFLSVFFKFNTIYDLRFTINEIVFLIYSWIIIGILIAIFFIDLEHYIIPDSLIIIGSIASLLYLLINQFSIFNFQFTNDSRISLFFNKLVPISNLSLSNSHFINHLLFAIIGLAFFGIIILLTRGKGMGIGDMKLAFFMGLVLGEKLLIALYFAFVVGALVGIILILFKKKKLNSMVPFGPFLVVATILLMLV